MLERIKKVNDIKSLTINELKELAQDMRDALTYRLSHHGGHVGPNFGMVEATIALHYVFHSPIDKFVFDVSHQSYCHKMLTGRKEAYLDEKHFEDVSGYTNPDESEHDFFNVGHTSTSISLASGLAKARDLKGDHENIIAIIGDGSLSGGEALEGLDFISELQSNFIIVVNDNDMSIAENHGGLYKNLKELRESKGKSPCNLFKAMGLDYRYVEDGNHLESLIETFNEVKDIDHGVVVHINTLKGKGLSFAEENKEAWHWHNPFDKDSGELLNVSNQENYETITCDYLMKKMKADPNVVAVVAGVPTSIGFSEEKRKEAGKQFVDVGIAEEHAVAMVSGIAKNKGKPVFATHSSFMQRTYDQISQDLCINKNPATLLINTASVYGMNDITHLGIFDIPLISNIPNIVYLAPTSKEEYIAMLDWSIEQTQYPVAIRIPCHGVISDHRQVDSDYHQLNTYKVEQAGEKIAILALGDFYQLGEELSQYIEEQFDIKPTLINPRFITGLDKPLLDQLKDKHELVITLEDGILDGGFGQKIASYFGTSSMKVKNYGLKKEFIDRYDVHDVLADNGITNESIGLDIQELIDVKGL